MRNRFFGFIWLMSCLTPVIAAPNPVEYHKAVYALHEKQIAQHKIRTEEEKGKYEGASAARYSYVDTRYYDAENGHLLSYVRRDGDDPSLVHIIEFNIFENDRIARDFGTVTLPWKPLNPIRTIINFHQYNGALHSYRQYTIYGEVEYEFCEGNLAGIPVKISLEEADLNNKNRSTAEYKACFDGVKTDWAQYTNPH